jgi:hypothetical protein
MAHIKVPEKAHMQMLLDVVNQTGLRGQIGG